jgi:hypothetical protein
MRKVDSIKRATLVAVLALAPVFASHADEGGASAWLPGQFASFAAVPGDPGFSLESIYYYRSANATAGATFTRGGGITAGYDTTEQFLYLTPSYIFSEPVLRGQLSVGATFAVGKVDSSVWAVLSGPFGRSFSAGQNDSVTGIGDLYPIASLKWKVGSHNFMTYLTASVPLGLYDYTRLATVGIGHWAIDGGLGYTFLSPGGFEFSVTAGLTQNFMNPSTQYQSGTDGHLDFGLSYSLTESFYIGAVGYLYNQVGADSGPGARLGDFKSRVEGAGPQAGYSFHIGRLATELNLRGYKEFDAQNRPEGWNVWLTLSFSRARHAAGE